jgi:hypothetical protein
MKSLKGFKLVPKPKLRGEGPKGELMAPPHHSKLKLQKLDNAFDNELGLNKKIKSHMQNIGHHIKDGPNLNFQN